MQQLIDLKNGCVVDRTVGPVVVNANTNGAAVDLANAADLRTNAIVNIGAITGAAVVSVVIQESDDTTSGNFVALADTANTNTGNLNTANTVTVLSFQRSKRYCRAVVTLVSGTSNVMAVEIVAQKKVEGSNAGGYSLSPAA